MALSKSERNLLRRAERRATRTTKAAQRRTIREGLTGPPPVSGMDTFVPDGTDPESIPRSPAARRRLWAAEAFRDIARKDARDNFRLMVPSKRDPSRLVMARRKATPRELANAKRSASLRAYWNEVRTLEAALPGLSRKDARQLAQLARDPRTAALVHRIVIFDPSPDRPKRPRGAPSRRRN